MKKPIDFDQIVSPDHLASMITGRWQKLNNFRSKWIEDKKEINRYLFATDTKHTEVSKLPWFHSTTTPKLTQIRDNLHANYFSALFPNRQWLRWEGEDSDSQAKEKRQVIQSYTENKLRKSGFINTISDLLYDWIDYGNCFAMVEHEVEYTTTIEGEVIPKYVGPKLYRISPYDIAFDPSASTFKDSIKIIKTVMTLGQVKKLAEKGDPSYQALLEKLRTTRSAVGAYNDSQIHKSESYVADGFGSITQYYESDMVEFLTLYGDIYDKESDVLYTNYKVTIADRIHVVSMEPINRWDGTDGIHHVGWRTRNDNLYAMGPLDNLVGMQYRIDHLENMKATIFDQIGMGMMKIKGDVEDFEFSPMGRIYCGDEGDVEFLHPDSTVLNADFQIQALENKMEEMAGMPKTALGFRTPGEKTAFEVNSLLTSAARIFQHKSAHYERMFIEPIVNDFLEVGRRNMEVSDIIRVLDDATGIYLFETITKEDIVASGTIIPVGARHFAERAQKAQELLTFIQVQDNPKLNPHISGKMLAEMMAMQLGEERLYAENVALYENAESMTVSRELEIQMANQEQTAAQEGL